MSFQQHRFPLLQAGAHHFVVTVSQDAPHFEVVGKIGIAVPFVTAAAAAHSPEESYVRFVVELVLVVRKIALDCRGCGFVWPDVQDYHRFFRFRFLGHK